MQAYGRMTPTEQYIARDAMKALDRGEMISREEEALVGQLPQGQKKLQDQYYRQAIQGGYLDMLRETGTPEKELNQIQGGIAGTPAAQVIGKGFGVNLPAVEINVSLDEAALVAEMKKEFGDRLKEIDAVVRQINEKVFSQDAAMNNRSVQAGSSITGAALGRK